MPYKRHVCNIFVHECVCVCSCVYNVWCASESTGERLWSGVGVELCVVYYGYGCTTLVGWLVAVVAHQLFQIKVQMDNNLPR